MTDLELLKSAGLYKKNANTGEEGITLAGIMLFGKDEIISSVNPYCRTDALYRVDDLDRYDDRDFVETNLLDMYDRLLDFISKHTMDRFALDENVRRISSRNIMAKEIILNEESSEFKYNEEKIKVPIGGKHFIYNALCATAVGESLNIDLKKIKQGIESFELTQKRMEIIQLKNGAKIINDS